MQPILQMTSILAIAMISIFNWIFSNSHPSYHCWQWVHSTIIMKWIFWQNLLQ